MTIQEDVESIRKTYEDYLIKIHYYTERNRTLDEFMDGDK